MLSIDYYCSMQLQFYAGRPTFSTLYPILLNRLARFGFLLRDDEDWEESPGMPAMYQILRSMNVRPKDPLRRKRFMVNGKTCMTLLRVGLIEAELSPIGHSSADTSNDDSPLRCCGCLKDDPVFHCRT